MSENLPSPSQLQEVMQNPKNFTPIEIKVMAKSLIENGFTSRKVESILGISYQSALNYSREETPEEAKEFLTVFDNWIKEQKYKGINMVYSRLLEVIPKEKRIDQLVKAGEYLEGKNNLQPVVPIQINNFVEGKKESYGI